MMIIFRDKGGLLLTEYPPRGATINDPYYASIIERLHSVILEERRGKVSRGVLLIHDNGPIHKCNIVQVAIRYTDFIELNHLAYFSDIAPTDYHLFSNLEKVLCGKDFSSDDEAITTVVDYFTDLNSESFCKGMQFARWVAACGC